MMSVSFFYVNKCMKDVFILKDSPDIPEYTDIKEYSQVWDYLNETFLDGIYWNDTESLLNIGEEAKMIMVSNILLGRPRLRMLKVDSSF